MLLEILNKFLGLEIYIRALEKEKAEGRGGKREKVKILSAQVSNTKETYLSG